MLKINSFIIPFNMKISIHSQSKIDHLSPQCDSNKMKILCLSLIKNEYDAMINNPEYSYYNSLPASSHVTHRTKHYPVN